MRQFFLISLFLLAFSVLPVNSQKVPAGFADPPREFSVMPFWFWNDTLKDAEIIRQIDDFEKHGVYGFVIHPRIGLPQNVKWLGPEMIHAMHVAIDEAAKRKMYVILYDEGMYPSGSSGGQVVARNPAHAARGLAKVDLKPGEEPKLADGTKLVTITERAGGSRVAIIDQPSGGNIRGLHYIGEGSGERIREDSPAAGDILNPEAVTSFMELVYDKYYHEFGKYFGSVIIGIFTDEPSPLGRGGARGVVPGNALIIPQINQILGYDITPHLADLWYTDSPEARKHRMDYHRAVNICLEENYYKRLGDWCSEHGIALMGHPAGSMDIGAERYFQMPGQDLVWRYVEPGDKAIRGQHSTMAKCASSAMVHLGFRRNSNELYGAYGHELTYDEMDWLANWCFVRGHNLLIPHAFYYSIRGPRFDERPPDVGPNAAWWKDYKVHADACRRLSWLNTDSRQVCSIAILGEATWLPDKTAEICYRNQRDFNYLEIRHLWEDAKTDSKGVHIAGMEYGIVILDSLSYIPEKAKTPLKTLARNGRLIIWDNSSLAAEFPGAVNVKNPAGMTAAIDRKIKPDIMLNPASGSIRMRHVKKDGDDFYLLFNEEATTVRTRIAPSVKGKSVWLDASTARMTGFSPAADVVFRPHEMKILWCPQSTASSGLISAPSGLMVEFIRDPSGVPVMDLKPEFTWIVPAEAGMQSACRIMIGSSEENLQNDKADVWDSGKVKSSNSVESECGIELSPSTQYFWKAMFWNDKGKPSEWSEIFRFKTGKPEGYATTSNRYMWPFVRPEKFRTVAPGHYFADFGKDAFGTLFLSIASNRSDTLIIHLGEKLSDDGRIDRNPGGSIRYSLIRMPLVPGRNEYTVSPGKDKRNTTGAAIILPDSAGVIIPFRYCEIEKCPVSLKAADLRQRVHHYYFEDENSQFTSSDTVLNQVWDICKYSMKATSFAGYYVDGDRERIPYEADAYINQLGHYYTDREYSLARRTNEYFIDHPTWPTEWILQTVPMFLNDYMFTGNIESIRNHYTDLRNKTLISLAGNEILISSKNVTDEIMKSIGFSNEKERIRDIVDWPPAQKDTGWKLATPEGERDGYEIVDVNTVVNAFYYNGLQQFSQIASVLGKNEDAELFKNEALKVKKAFNDKLLDRHKGYYIDGIGSEHSSLHANMLALAFGLVPAENMRQVSDFIKTRGMACSVYGAQYLLEGLYRSGEEDYALSLMNALHDRSWYNMIRAGSTITLEAWDMKYKPNSDWNHAWGAAPASIIPGFMWGIAPATPGWAKAVIRPALGNLKESRISVPTIRGNIEAEFRVTGQGAEFTVSIPGNMECDFVVKEGKKAKLNGKAAKASKGVIKLKPGVNKIEIF
jgi:hypothetical protein